MRYWRTQHPRVLVGGVIITLIFLVSRSFPFWRSDIPLGYDPGLYKAMFTSYLAMGNEWSLTELPMRIQRMYEPRLWLWATLWLPMIGGRSDHILTRGRVIISSVSVGGMYLLGRRWGVLAWLLATFLVVTSFVQYELFWRSYWKQVLGLFIFCLATWLVLEKQWQVLWLVVPALLLTHRSSGVVFLLAVAIWIGVLYRQKQKHTARVLGGVVCLGILLAMPWWVALWQPLVVRVWSYFVDAIGTISLQDDPLRWGVFFTLREYVQVSWHVIIVWLRWYRLLLRQRKDMFLVVITSIVFLWVGAQLLFFQRMIGMMSLLLLLWAVYALAQRWVEPSKRGKWAVTIFCILHVSVFCYRIPRVYFPIITTDEFAFIRAQEHVLEPNAVVIVSGIWYSPWIKWRMDREVIAPGLFDHQQRGTLDEGRTTQWLSVSAATKCTNVLHTFPWIADRPVYVRQGSKQPPTDLAGACFVPLKQTAQWSRWKLAPQ